MSEAASYTGLGQAANVGRMNEFQDDMMKTWAWMICVAFLAGCTGYGNMQTSGASGTAGAGASGAGGGGWNTDVSDAVSRGSTRGYSPFSPLPER